MDEAKVEIIETTLEVSTRDQLIVAVLGAVAGFVASKLTERGYYSAKARYLTRNTTPKPA